MRGEGFAPVKRCVLRSLLGGNWPLREAVKPSWGSAEPSTFAFQPPLPLPGVFREKHSFHAFSFQLLEDMLSPCPQGVPQPLCLVGREEDGVFPSAAIQAGCRQSRCPVLRAAAGRGTGRLRSRPRSWFCSLLCATTSAQGESWGRGLRPTTPRVGSQLLLISREGQGRSTSRGGEGRMQVIFSVSWGGSSSPAIL